MTSNPLAHEKTTTVLIIDDEAGIVKFLKALLEDEGYIVSATCNAFYGKELLSTQRYDILLCDIMMPGMDGITLLEQLNTHLANTAIIAMSAFGGSEMALQTIKLGAHDFIAKPFGQEEILFVIRKAEEHLRLQRENSQLKDQLARPGQFTELIGESPKMQAILETISIVASHTTNVLIQGESGTGKELIAKAIHKNSERSSKPFIAINCSAIPEQLLESELFGYKRGAFTDATRDKKGLLEEAHNGTLFLDEIGDMSKSLQVKLLRALQEKTITPVGDSKSITINTRIIAATNRKLENDIKTGRFRDDLYYRLNVIGIEVPPLRNRKEDIPSLIAHFTDKSIHKLNVAHKYFSPEALDLLYQYSWPGNIRELQNCVEHCLVLCRTDVIGLSDIPSSILKNFTATDSPLLDDNLSIKEQVANLEKFLIKKALAKTSGNQNNAAKLLGISIRSLAYKIKEYGITKSRIPSRYSQQII